MKTHIKILSLIFSILILFSFIVSANEESYSASFELEKENMQFTLPENTVALTPDTPLSSSNWAIAGISDPATFYSKYKELSAAAHFAYIGGLRNVYLSANSSSATKAVFNLTACNGDVKEKIISQYHSLNDNEGVTATSDYIDINGIDFIKTHIVSNGESKSEELCYATIMNGVSYTFTILSQSGALQEEETKFIEDIVYSLKFTAILEAPTNELTQKDKSKLMIYLIILVVVLSSVAIYTKLKKRSFIKQKQAYVETITQFREERKKLESSPDFKETPPLFLNKTVHSDALLHKLSIFQAYRKNLLTIPGYSLCIILSLYLAIMLRKEFLFILIFGAIIVFSCAKLFFSQGKYDRTFKRMYSKFPNRNAIFTFREDNFKLSGLQSNNIFPYIQITDAYETKDTFYLYFGEELCYIVSKEGFALGTPDDFSDFLKRKLNKHFHKR